MIENLERIESAEKKAEIDDFIYTHYEEFKPYVYLFEDVAGLTSEAEQKYHRGHSSGLSKTYIVTKGGLTYRMKVELIKDHDDLEDGLDCSIHVR